MGERVRAAEEEALRRQQREGRQLAPLRLWVVGIVVVVAATSKPAIGVEGRHLVLLLALVVFVAEMLALPVVRLGGAAGRVVELCVMGTAAVALVVVQPNGVSELPGSAVVFIAGVALEPLLAIVVGAAVTIAVAAALASVGGVGAASIAASALLCAVLGLTGGLLRRYRLSQSRAELLFAELEEARDDQARAAAAEERQSIARELHDVLAHSLSGLSIQLEVARKLAASLAVPDELRRPIEGAAGLAKQGLVEARAAVTALRRDDELGLERLPELVEHFRRDLHLEVRFSSSGPARQIAPELGLALYRVAGEALTNVARHARGAATTVELAYDLDEVRLVVSDEGGEETELSSEGSGWGLSGMRERIRRLGGELHAGPAGTGWSVVATMPA
ncbi:MAG TPA: histidine kinase [Acidimicrobiales bacterium]|nr:histidine kinase [Acidimicrobiales bacterium]